MKGAALAFSATVGVLVVTRAQFGCASERPPATPERPVETPDEVEPKTANEARDVGASRAAVGEHEAAKDDSNAPPTEDPAPSSSEPPRKFFPASKAGIDLGIDRGMGPSPAPAPQPQSQQAGNEPR